MKAEGYLGFCVKAVHLLFRIVVLMASDPIIKEKIVTRLMQRIKTGEGRSVVEPDLSSLKTELNIDDHSNTQVRKAISSLHHKGVINCGRPHPDEIEGIPYGGRGWKITPLVKP